MVEERIAVGRAPDTALSLAWDSQVSRPHAELERVGHEWVVGRRPVAERHVRQRLATCGRRRLIDGDVLRFGLTAILSRADARGPLDRLGETPSGRGQHPRPAPRARRAVPTVRRRPGSPPASNPQIAEHLFLSVAAVKTHLRALSRAFDIDGLPQQEKRHRLVALAFASGIVSERDLAGHRRRNRVRSP